MIEQIPVTDRFQEALYAAITKVVEEEISKAVQEIEGKVRGRVGEIATRIATSTDFERFQDRLVISVRFPKSE